MMLMIRHLCRIDFRPVNLPPLGKERGLCNMAEMMVKAFLLMMRCARLYNIKK
jgi:hypothetical protein